MVDKQFIEGTLIPKVKADLSWLQKYERVVIVFLMLLVGGWLGNHWINISADKAAQTATVAIQQLNDQKKQNEQIAADNARQSEAYIQLIAQVQQQNAEIKTAMSARNAELGKQQTKDKTLPIPELIDRWNKLAGIPEGDILPVGDGQKQPNAVIANDEATRQTVIQLEQIPVLEKNLDSTQQILASAIHQNDQANGLIGKKDTQIAGLNTQIKDEEAACKAEVAYVKAGQRKSKRNWFVGGFISGTAAVAALVIHFL